MLQEEEWTNAKYVLDEETKEITEDIDRSGLERFAAENGKRSGGLKTTLFR